MSNLVKVGEVGDLQPGECKSVVAGEREIALFNIEGKLCATDNVCPHRGGPLGEGSIDGKLVTCPWHGWQFDVCTGISPVMPTAKIDVFEVVVEGNDVKVKI